MAAEPRRRALLAAAAAGSLGLAGSLAGCKGLTALGPVPPVTQGVRTLERTIAAEEQLVGTYDAALARLGTGSTATTAVLTAIRAEHQAHLRQLRAKLILPSRLAGTTIKPMPAAALPAGRSVLLGALAAGERAAVARLTSDLLAVPSALAQLMASISASEAAHVVFLHRAGSR